MADNNQWASYICKACGAEMTLGRRWRSVYRPDMQLGCTPCGVDRPITEYLFPDGTEVAPPTVKT